MKTISDQKIEGQSVVLDGKRFVNCTLTNCTLEYSGNDVVFERTTMRDCRHVFYGQARRTLHYLQGVGLMQYSPTDWAEFPGQVH